jgi:hypothetical protein
MWCRWQRAAHRAFPPSAAFSLLDMVTEIFCFIPHLPSKDHISGNSGKPEPCHQIDIFQLLALPPIRLSATRNDGNLLWASGLATFGCLFVVGDGHRDLLLHAFSCNRKHVLHLCCSTGVRSLSHIKRHGLHKATRSSSFDTI